MIQYNERTSNDDGEVVGSRKSPLSCRKSKPFSISYFPVSGRNNNDRMLP
jgi:hypothetical protein